ncbi:hypothetical protein JW905_05845, partial [bacterium]|nr:hypothetical protein [candidate division CSSED10-310 bacterium]
IAIGPFNNPVQTVNTVDFVIHFNDDSWDNNNGADYHITVSQSAPTATPTPTTPPHHTATPTPSPDPMTSPTPQPGEVVINLLLNEPWFRGGDLLSLRRQAINSSGEARQCNEWIALEAYGIFYFHPAWDETPAAQPLNLAPGAFRMDDILQLALPVALTPSGPYFFHAILTDRDTGAIMTPLDTEVFGFY